MKILSFKKPVSFTNGQVVVEDLALNHHYKKEKDLLTVEGKDEKNNITYKAVYNSRGKFLFIKLKTSSHSVALLSWRQEYDTETVEKIDKEGNSFCEVSVYSTTDTWKHKLVKRSFTSKLRGEEVTKTFFIKKGEIRTEGDFPRMHFSYWI